MSTRSPGLTFARSTFSPTCSVSVLPSALRSVTRRRAASIDPTVASPRTTSCARISVGPVPDVRSWAGGGAGGDVCSLEQAARAANAAALNIDAVRKPPSHELPFRLSPCVHRANGRYTAQDKSSTLLRQFVPGRSRVEGIGDDHVAATVPFLSCGDPRRLRALRAAEDLVTDRSRENDAANLSPVRASWAGSVDGRIRGING